MKKRIVEELKVAMLMTLPFAAIIFVGLFIWSVQASAKQDIELQPMYATSYCLTSPRCDGGETRKGICAIKGHYGEIACVYKRNKDGSLGNFIGYYEVLDYCPSGSVVDIWIPYESSCRIFGGKKVYVKFIKDAKGWEKKVKQPKKLARWQKELLRKNSYNPNAYMLVEEKETMIVVQNKMDKTTLTVLKSKKSV